MVSNEESIQEISSKKESKAPFMEFEEDLSEYMIKLELNVNKKQ